MLNILHIAYTPTLFFIMLTCIIPVISMHSIRVENSVDPDQMAYFDVHCLFFIKNKKIHLGPGFSRANVKIVTFPLFINRLSKQILTTLFEWSFIVENCKN